MYIKDAIPTVPSVATSGEGKDEDEYLRKASDWKVFECLDIP